MATGTSWGRRIRGFFVWVAITVGLTAVVSECGLRVAGVGFPEFHERDTRLGWRLIPNAEGMQHEEGAAHVQINSDGMRDREHALAKPADTYRIAFLGDSYTEALQVEVDKTYWAEVERRLGSCPKLAGKKVEVLNFGVSAYGTANEYLVLQDRVWKYAPDSVVLAFYTGNDLKDNTRPLDPLAYRPYYDLKDGQLVLDTSRAEVVPPLTSRIWQGARAHSNLVQLLQRIRNSRATKSVAQAEDSDPEVSDAVFAEPKSEKWKNAWTITEALLSAVAGDVKSHGATFTLAVLSAPIQVDWDPTKRDKLAARLGVTDLFYPDRHLVEYGDAHGFAAVALAPELQKQALASKKCLHGFTQPACQVAHYNEDGHRAAGDLLADEMCKRM